MNREEILNEINKTKEHLVNMEKMLKECNKRWKPNDFCPYFYVDSCMKIEESNFYNDTYIHSERYNTYGTFKTKEEAQREVEKILIRRQLEDIARRLNKEQRVDWSNNTQRKYTILFLTSNDTISCVPSSMRKIQGAVYCLDIDFDKIAIQEIGEERLKKYLKDE